MHSQKIDMQAWADVHEGLECPVYGEVGPASITTGEHPEFGAIIAIHTLEGVQLISELPYQDEIDRQFAGEDEVARAVVAAATTRRRRAGSH